MEPSVTPLINCWRKYSMRRAASSPESVGQASRDNPGATTKVWAQVSATLPNMRPLSGLGAATLYRHHKDTCLGAVFVHGTGHGIDPETDNAADQYVAGGHRF